MVDLESLTLTLTLNLGTAVLVGVKRGRLGLRSLGGRGGTRGGTGRREGDGLRGELRAGAHGEGFELAQPEPPLAMVA